MPFRLKNAGATYQRAMVTLFHDLMHKEVEVYVDDMIIKSRGAESHVAMVRKVFERLRKYRLKLNPIKCVFGAKLGKLLGFIVSEKGIEIDPDKVKAIQEMPAPQTKKEVRSFLGKLKYISRFISNLTARAEPIFKLLRKNNSATWNDDCQEAFENIKNYLSNPPILVPPILGRPLILYMAVLQVSMGCVLGQHDDSGKKERAIYYMSKKFNDCEARYSFVERTCCALAWTANRLKHYMLNYKTWLISRMDPIKYVFESPYLPGRIAKWQVILSQYDIVYITRKALKGSIIADLLAENPIEEYEALDFEFSDEYVNIVEEEMREQSDVWQMYFDGAVNLSGSGIGSVLVSPDGKHFPIVVKLEFECTNNVAEYEACVNGLQADIEMKIKKLEVYSDSALIIYQVKGESQTRDSKLIPYQKYLIELIKKFDEISFTHLSRDKNQLADALATLAVMAQIEEGKGVQILLIKARDNPAYYLMIEEEMDGKPWYYDIQQYIKTREYPQEASKNDKRMIRRISLGYFPSGEILYTRNFDGELLRCVHAKEAKKILLEMYEGNCATHANGHMMARQILRRGYFLLTLEKDCIEYFRRCHKCQIYANRINAPPHQLFNLVAPWPFAMWGMDVIGLITLKASNGHQYGLPDKLITDNAKNLNGSKVKELCDQYKIHHLNSSPYRPQMNGAVEAANKNLKKIIEKMTITYRDWHEVLPFALHAYRTAVRTSTGATPYSLVYGMEAVSPIEVEIPSLRILAEAELDDMEWVQTRLDQLNLIDEKRLATVCHGQLYQSRMARAFDKKLCAREFQPGDIILKKVLLNQSDLRGK
ncbi:uncharacterized protein LOC110648488 [Hevea brasiliensis]|uniref:uncharacterized protein LOC110648488 n=1 Tax=Hevea brasiliensis TaxID=3981 RepID=UPI0025E59E4A|nr:uncharacterized protein LOC110648488 [Hevea brasiliensis]